LSFFKLVPKLDFFQAIPISYLYQGATTFGVATLSRMTFKMALRILTLSIMTQRITTPNIVILFITTLSILTLGIRTPSIRTLII